jgi:hypothetical protein
MANLPAKAKGRREMLEVADAYLKLEARLLSMRKAPWACRKSLLEIGDASCADCLRSLRPERIELYQLHAVDHRIPRERPFLVIGGNA